MEWASGHYYWQEKCYNLMNMEVSKATGPLGGGLGEGVALALNDRMSDALNKLILVVDQCPLAAHLAMLYAHKHCQVVDREAVVKLEGYVREEKKKTEVMDLYYAALVLYLTGALNEALELVERHNKLRPDSSLGLTLLGWMKTPSDKKAAAAHFASALKYDKDNVDALFGEVNLLGASEGVHRLNQAVVRHPKCITPLLVKMRLQLASREWEQAEDTAARVLMINPSNIYTLHLKALKRVVLGKYEESLEFLKRVKEEIERQEPKAWWLYTVLGGACARSCGGDDSVLCATIAMARAAIAIAPTPASIEPLLELAYQAFLAEDFSLSSKTYRTVTKMDDSSIKALIGLTMVQFATSGPTVQVKQQVEFLREVTSSVENDGGGGELLLLEAKLQPEDCSKLLDRAVASLQADASQHPFGARYLISINTDLLLRIAKTYPNSPDGDRKRAAVFGLIVDTTPGVVEASILVARSHLSLGRHSTAMATVENIINNLDRTHPQAHLVMAQILIDQGDYIGAKSSLELGLSYNLKVREMPEYHLLCGIVDVRIGDDDAAIIGLRRALTLNKTSDSSNSLVPQDVIKTHLELSECLMRKGRLGEAEGVLQEGGQGNEGLLVLAWAQLALFKTDMRRALSLLSSVAPSHPNYIQVQKKKADIYLNIMKDELAYSECFRKLAESNPSTENFLMLGDAYLAIQEPELAVQSYERAMVSSSGDAKLSCRLARVLVRCHQYAKAIKCYRDSGDEGSLELAELLLKLGQMEKAESALSNLPLFKKAFILAKIYEKGGDIERALRTLEASVDEQPEQGKPQNNENLAKMNHQMAEYATMLRDFDIAIEYYKRSLSLLSDNPNAQISLAKLYMQVNDWSSCEAVCSSFLSNEPGNEPALLMLADLAFRRVDFSTAEKHFCALLEKRPNYWVALARLIEVLRRTARLSMAKTYLETAALVASSTPADQPPLAYCTGLYHWYSGNTSLAVQKFNEARGDPEWGQQAVHNMVEACIGEPAAQALLAEMKPSTRDEEAGLQLITAFVRMATEEKQEIERAMIDFTYLANNDAHKVGATLGLAMGYVLQKQSTRARNVLKRVAKSVWQFEQAEHLEKSWLLLADLYIQAGGGGKHEPAIDLLRRVISHNKSSSRAHELLGLIAEKEQKYAEASEHYSEAWKLSGECDPSLGYRLAYNLVKGKRYADAISVCHAVLKVSPDYPRIRKDVLDKALSHLRT